MEIEQKNEENKKNELKEEEEEEMEEEEEEEEEMAPRFIPKSERILSLKEQEKKANNNIKKDKKDKNTQIINKTKNEEKTESKINKNDNKDKDNKKKDNNKDIKESNSKDKDDKEKDKNKDNENSKGKEEDSKAKKEKENDILTDNILSIRNSLDKIHQQNIKYLIDLEKKKNEAKKHTIVDLDEDEPENNNNNNNTTKFVKQKKLKSQQEKIYIHLPDDTDDQNDINEYNNWKERELKRIKRDIEKYESFIKEQEEIKKRRLMTETEIKEDNIRLGADSTKNRFRSKISFLQKYYHKGVFFQDEAEDDPNHVYNRDFNLPTWEDTIDKTNLPKLLAKRRGNVWRKSQSKYTHLNDADTTNFDKNFVVPENILAKIQRLSKKK